MVNVKTLLNKFRQHRRNHGHRLYNRLVIDNATLQKLLPKFQKLCEFITMRQCIVPFHSENSSVFLKRGITCIGTFFKNPKYRLNAIIVDYESNCIYKTIRTGNRQEVRRIEHQ